MSSPVAPQLLEELFEHVASGTDAYVATRDDALEPESMFAMGTRVHADRGTLTVYLPEALAAATCRNLEANGEIAVTLNKPPTCRGFQVKGTLLSIRPSDETDREFQQLYRASLGVEFEAVGVPRSTTRRLAWWPSLAVEIEIRDIFVQTPGPGAGEPMNPRSAAGGDRETEKASKGS